MERPAEACELKNESKGLRAANLRDDRFCPTWGDLGHDTTLRIDPRDHRVRLLVTVVVQEDAIRQHDRFRQSFEAAHESPPHTDFWYVMSARTCAPPYAHQALMYVIQTDVDQRYVVSGASSVAEHL